MVVIVALRTPGALIVIKLPFWASDGRPGSVALLGPTDADQC
jgi:hypothetical protein